MREVNFQHIPFSQFWPQDFSQSGTDNKIIMKFAGHRSEKGLNMYMRVSFEQDLKAPKATQVRPSGSKGETNTGRKEKGQ